MTFEGHAEVLEHVGKVRAATLVHVAEGLTHVDPLTRPARERKGRDLTLQLHETAHIPRSTGKHRMITFTYIGLQGNKHTGW